MILLHWIDNILLPHCDSVWSRRCGLFRCQSNVDAIFALQVYIIQNLINSSLNTSFLSAWSRRYFQSSTFKWNDFWCRWFGLSKLCYSILSLLQQSFPLHSNLLLIIIFLKSMYGQGKDFNYYSVNICISHFLSMIS